jgi:hypothetical protein
MIYLNNAIRFFRTGLTAFVLLLTIFTLASSNAYAVAPNPNPTPTPTPSPNPSPSPSPSPNPTPSPGPTPSPSPSPSPSPTPDGDNDHCSIRFSAPGYSVNEGAGSTTITVFRTCDRVRDSKVDFFTRSNTASDRSDFTFASGRLFFAPGETQKTFNVLVSDDALVEGDEALTLTLTDPGESARLVSPSVVMLTIVDNDTVQPVNNPIDNASFFVQQHYADFLNRAGDDGGLHYWKEKIENCGADDNCVRRERINVSAAFFVETEFQETGSFVYRMYKAGLGRQPNFGEFMPDRSRVVDSPDLEANKTLFATEWVERPAFKALYPDTLTIDQFVNKLMATAGLSHYTDLQQQFITEMRNGATRAQILRKVIEVPEFKAREYNAAFVLMQYFGYLRRDPDQGGYEFWLGIINNKVPNNYKAMVCAFLTSTELQDRFSTRQTRNNSECGP